ncbi:hypothetical protein ABW19_dt0206041 [Dactylella cylindrospora]|nr:hypothetical protein ABW19_dt0206041 [Dactylella cylindrospora]
MRFSPVSILAVAQAVGIFNLAAAELCCKPLPSKCGKLPRQSASACSSLFVRSKVKLSTCTSTPATVTTTKRVTPTVTLTLTTTSTATVSRQGPTVGITATEEYTSVSTSITTLTTEATETTTTTSTSTVSSIPGSNGCSRIPFRRRDEENGLFVKRGSVPTQCSCFLTTTKVLPRKTKTVTTTLPKVTVRRTSTKRVTVTKVLSGATRTFTEYTTSTSIVESVTTTTLVQTQTDSAEATVTVLPPSLCDNPYTFNGRNAFTYSGVLESDDGDGVTTLSDCCRKCYTTQNCANYMFDTATNVCKIYLVPSVDTADRCVNDVCDYGHAYGSFEERPTTELYSPGPCGGGIQR